MCEWRRYPITGVQLQKEEIRYLSLNTLVIVHRLRDILARGEPITIEIVVTDTINVCNNYRSICSEDNKIGLANFPSLRLFPSM